MRKALIAFLALVLVCGCGAALAAQAACSAFFAIIKVY